MGRLPFEEWRESLLEHVSEVGKQTEHLGGVCFVETEDNIEVITAMSGLDRRDQDLFWVMAAHLMKAVRVTVVNPCWMKSVSSAEEARKLVQETETLADLPDVTEGVVVTYHDEDGVFVDVGHVGRKEGEPPLIYWQEEGMRQLAMVDTGFTKLVNRAMKWPLKIRE